jgi:DNA-binding response OmpR family regulator
MTRGSSPQDNKDTPYEDVVGLLGEMKKAVNNPIRFDYLSDQIEIMARAYCVPNEVPAISTRIRLTKCERRLLNVLYAHRNKTTTNGQIMDALYFDSMRDEPNPEVIGVFVHSLRKKIKGLPWEIRNIHGEGFELVEK